jgi:hypothetical protein
MEKNPSQENYSDRTSQNLVNFWGREVQLHIPYS